MGPVDAFWHLSNLFGPAVGMALLAPSLAKLLWQQELRAVRWSGLALWTFAACAVVLLLGLLLTGRDGRMSPMPRWCWPLRWCCGGAAGWPAEAFDGLSRSGVPQTVSPSDRQRLFLRQHRAAQ